MPSPSYSMKHNKSFQDQYQPPDDDDENMDRTHARFDRLARKLRDESDTAVTKFIHIAIQHVTPISAQSSQGQLPMVRCLHLAATQHK
jgi:hypothetical protein